MQQKAHKHLTFIHKMSIMYQCNSQATPSPQLNKLGTTALETVFVSMHNLFYIQKASCRRVYPKKGFHLFVLLTICSLYILKQGGAGCSVDASQPCCSILSFWLLDVVLYVPSVSCIHLYGCPHTVKKICL